MECMNGGRPPVRTCVGCRAKRPRALLWRLVVDGDGRVRWDPDRRLEGRGAWVCGSRECLTEALKKGRLARAFRRPVHVEALEKERAPWE